MGPLSVTVTGIMMFAMPGMGLSSVTAALEDTGQKHVSEQLEKVLMSPDVHIVRVICVVSFFFIVNE